MTDDEIAALVCGNCGYTKHEHPNRPGCCRQFRPWGGHGSGITIAKMTQQDLEYYRSILEAPQPVVEQWGDLLTIEDKQEQEPECSCDMRELMSNGHLNSCAWKK